MNQIRFKATNNQGQDYLRDNILDYVVGIDTGGTYTDGVLLDYHTRNILASAKTLTTYDNLTKGVITVLQELKIEHTSKVKLVGISSTLATNSIAEGKTRRVGLLLIGYDEDLIRSYGLDAKFSTRNFAFFQGGHNAQGEEQAQLDTDGIKDWVQKHQGSIDALAISSYFSPLNPDHEEEALKVIQKNSSLPVVLGHQLSTKLDSIKRATTASLNASLVAVMHEFIEAVQDSLKDLGIRAPLMIVKGDGSLMPYNEAAQKPVETILSGPAASSIGGRFLSGQSGALVIDVGGTTTDMALIENSQIAVSNEGARVGDIETAVKAAKIRTACVGCDSRISFISSHEFQVGPDRVVPLSRLASLYPEVERELNNLSNKRSSTLNIYDIEYWHLSKQIDIESHSLIDRNIRADLIKLLQARPLSLTYILAKLNVHHPVQLNADTLIQQGIIERVTLTPTDLLHANGQLNIWNTDCARFILDHVCKIYRWQQGAFIEEVLHRIVSTMVEESVIFLARQDLGLRLPEGIDGSWGRWFFDEGLEEKNNYLSVNISSRFPIIGIGAPANIFIKKVADILHTRFILPSHPHVANAVGAVAGSVIVEKEAIIYVQETQDKRVFIVRFEGETTSFKQSEDAFVYAEKMALKSARHGANEAGAVDPQVQVQRLTEGALQRIQVRAVGNPRLSEEWGTVNN